jgi:hypothetical protein
MTIQAILADFKTEPYLHQLQEFERSCELSARALIWQMRTGKTKLIIDTACHLFLAGRIDAVVVFAPNGVHENWIQRELGIHSWETVDRAAWAWRTDLATDPDHRAHLEALLACKGKLPWFSFASATMTRPDVRKVLARIIRRRKKILAIFDESHDYRSPSSKRSMMARAFANKSLFKRILTGTPVDNSPLHAWSQYELLRKGALGFGTYEDFKDFHAEYKMVRNFKTGRSFPQLDKYVELDRLRDRLAPWSSVVLRSDCADLPELVVSERPVEPTELQKRLYEEARTALEVMVEGKEISLGEAPNRLIKLQQIMSGFLRDEYKETHILPGVNPRLEMLKREVLLTSGRVIVWCQFRQDLDLVAKAMRAIGREVLEYHGRTSSADKAKARVLMGPGTGDYGPDLVGQAQSGGSGLDLSSASKIIWYSHTFDAIVKGQADERATAMGGRNIELVHFVAPGVDRYILDALAEKESIASAISREGLAEVLRKIAI